MGYILGMCPQCNNVMSMPDDSLQVQCPTCHSIVMAAEAAALAGSSDQMQTGTAPQNQQEPANSPYADAANSQSGYAQPDQGSVPFGAPGNPYSTSQPPITWDPAATSGAVNGTWLTNVPFTILGLLAAAVLNGITASVEGTNMALAFVSLVYVVFAVVYAVKIYPSYFTAKPDITNVPLINFLNTFVGGIIFGLLWNHNLTRNQKGISNIVFVALIASVFVLAFLAGIMIGLGSVA